MNYLKHILQDPDVREELKKIISEVVSPISEKKEPNKVRYIRGVNGLARYLNISYPQAHRMKREELAPAVHQRGRTILFDGEKVDEILFGGNEK